MALACHGAALAFSGGPGGGRPELAAAGAAPRVLRLAGRPARCLAYLREDVAAAAGAGGQVLLLRRGGGGEWAALCTLHGALWPGLAAQPGLGDCGTGAAAASRWGAVGGHVRAAWRLEVCLDDGAGVTTPENP